MPKQERTTVPVKKDVLRWARNTRGLSTKDAATKLKITEGELEQFENGNSQPDLETFDRMVSAYKQPESVLLLTTPPPTIALPRDFRTSGGRRAGLTPETRLALREARELQQYVSELVIDDPQLIKSLKIKPATTTENPEQRAAIEREHLGVSLAVQLRWKPQEDSFNRWRDWLEKKGLIILLKKMPWKDCRGFLLLEEDMLPTIVINSEDMPSARIFSLFHEYAHLLLGAASICQATRAQSPSERWCNEFASAFLLPRESIKSHVKERFPLAGKEYDWPVTAVTKLATYYRVSRPAMAIRLQKLGLAIPDYYEKHKAELHSYDARPKPEDPPRIKKNPGWKQKRKLNEVGLTAASVILKAWNEQIADAMEAADVLDLSLDELYGLEQETQEQKVRYVG